MEKKIENQTISPAKDAFSMDFQQERKILHEKEVANCSTHWQ
jgi:hypothetical protein